MAVPTAGLSYDKPTGYVMPMIRAGMIETPREGRPRNEAPEIAVLSDCFKQFEHEGLQRLVMDLACTAAEATIMFSEHSPLSPLELLQQFSAQHAVDMATDRTLKDGDVVWGYIPSMVRPIFEPEARPGMAEVLFEIDRKYGFHTSMDFLVALAYYSGAVARRLSEATSRSTDEVLQELEKRAEPIWAGLDAFDTRDYMTL
ncbi:hypothetical protein [Streptomyces sp. NPDC051704]|uniref:hypothetical protein n=1 Tax=Streptomyces sp. NPDC051704 TaxID=3365671 RepID=UPI0037A29851